MKNIEPTHLKDGFVLLPSVTHPQGREKAFDDCFKALVRTMIEAMHNPTIAYAIWQFRWKCDGTSDALRDYLRARNVCL